MLRALATHDVDFILIGGFAAAAYGSPLLTHDIDIVPSTDGDNPARLSKALKKLRAKVRAGDEVFPFDHDGHSLATAKIWNLTTKYGDLDITFMPSGTQGYDDLKRDAIEITLRGTPVKLAAL